MTHVEHLAPGAEALWLLDSLGAILEAVIGELTLNVSDIHITRGDVRGLGLDTKRIKINLILILKHMP